MPTPIFNMKERTTMQYLTNPRDCTITRDEPGYPASVCLFDAEGELIARFDEDWTDDQVICAVEFANKAYNKGFNCGRNDKATEIRRALNGL